MLRTTNNSEQPTALYLVATPIGNLEDITMRAVRVLRDVVSTIACEDTRQTSKLLQHYEIRKPLLSYHEHNEAERTQQILKRLEAGESVAVVSDAGTPLISDPGYRVVQAAIDSGFLVIPIPGPAAFLAALVGSGLPTDEFRYIGFLPAKTGARRRLVLELESESTTVVAYESPHRIRETLEDLGELLPNRQLVIARELTKVHEEFVRGSAAEVAEEFKRRTSIKGEFVIVISGGGPALMEGEPTEIVQKLEAEGMPRKEAIKEAAKQLGLPKREVYRLLTELPAANFEGAAERDNS